MKKVFLTGAALMTFAAAGFAQNTATLNQNGNSQSASQNQSGNTLTSVVTQGTSSDSPVSKGNTAFTDQRQNHNTTTVTQTAAQYNQGFVYQNTFSGKASGGATNEATIQQIGSGSANGLYPGDPNSTPSASGSPTPSGNVARIGQEDAGNHAAIEQDGAGLGMNYSNYGRIDQFHGNNGATTSDVYIHQNGKSWGNVASIQEMTSGAGKATIEQNGLTAGEKSVGNTATINQSSMMNGVTASIQQNAGSGDDQGTGNSINNKATVNQTGGTGDAAIQQNNGSGYAGANTATVNQSAGQHMAIVQQNNDSQRNTATVTQDGSSTDKAEVYQSGYSGDGTATIRQGAGNMGTNTAFINMQNQTGTVGASSATINQNVSGSGSGNVAEVDQGYYTGYASSFEMAIDGGISSHNRAQVDQNGSGNQAKLYQVGHDNQADIAQTGGNNIVKGTSAFRDANFAVQLGSGNTLTVTQSSAAMGPGNTAAVYQQGMGNTANIMQSNN